VSRPKAVILDVDGTLIDSNAAHAAAWVDAVAEFGHRVDFDHVRRLIGMGGDKVLPRITGVEKETEEGRRMSERRGEIFREKYLPSLKPFPAARALLERMKADGLSLVVASSASKEDLGALLDRAGVHDLIEEKTSSSDAEESKPDPDIVRAALKSAGVSPREAVMLGDTPYDVESAGRACVACVALRCGGWDADALAGAVAIYDGPADLLRRYDDSPFARSPQAGRDG
jgi:HAD superfamily hydrolase (TIGR01509 family)